MNNVIWKRMIYHGKDLGDYYLVSNTGLIKSVKTGIVRKQNINHEGYYFVCISLGSRKNRLYIKTHKAVAETFIPIVYEKNCINHKDGNKLNNNVENLEWCTRQENTIHAVKHGLLTNKHKRKKIKNVTTGIIYDSIADATRSYNVDNYESISNNIRHVLKGRNNSAYGCVWEYA